MRIVKLEEDEYKALKEVLEEAESLNSQTQFKSAYIRMLVKVESAREDNPNNEVSRRS